MSTILPQAQELLELISQSMPTVYQQETLQCIIALFLEGQGHSLPHHCTTKSESAISRFFNHYQWSTRLVIRNVRQCILNLILSLFPKGRKPTLQVILDLTTLEKTGKFPELEDLVRVYHGKKGLHIVVMYLVVGNWRFPWSFRVYRGKLGVYRWLILSLISYLLAYWVYLHLENNNNLDWFNSAQNALILLLPHILLLSLFRQLDTLIPWLNDRGFDFCLIRCKI